MQLTPIEIKIRILRNGDTIAGLARKWKCWPNDISRVIYKTEGRSLPSIRRKLALYLGVPLADIGREPTTRKPKRKAA